MSDRNWSVEAPTSLPVTEPLSASTAPEAPPVPRRQRRRVQPTQLAAEESGADAANLEQLEFAPSEPRAPRGGITVEHLLYLGIMLAAILTRFWDLGSKALHHDESLHTYYSWVFETGGGYRHHPLMHGPFLFHANALVYFLFGDSDATSRYAPAFFGVIMVGLPYFLRGPRFLGRWGALASSALILISPVLLYQSRYIRHDIYTLTGTLLLFVCIVRYLENAQRRWLVTGIGTIAFLLTNHEIVFAVVAIFFGYLYGALLWSRLKVWWAEECKDLVYMLLGLHALVGVLGAALLLFIPAEDVEHFYDIPWQNPTFDQQTEYYRNLLINPLFFLGVLLLAGYLAGMVYLFRESRDIDRLPEGQLEAVFGPAEPHSAEFGLLHAWRDKNGLWISLFVFVGIFATLFTSIYTNLYGLVSSTIATDGTLLYWLGQHDFRRGEQPWFYYALLLPQYEFFATLLGGAFAAVTLIRAAGSLFGWWSGGTNLFFRLYLVAWFLGIFVGLSYAGEKMPWLVSHISLPGTLLAGALIGSVVDRATAARRVAAENGSRRVWAWPEWALTAALVLIAFSWFGIAARLSNADFIDSRQAGGYTRTATEWALDRWWWLAIPALVAAAAIGVFTLIRGGRRAALASLAAFTLLVTLLQVHTGWRLSYTDPDVPSEMMIYTQTSPDVTRVMSEIQALSYELTGGNGLEVWYDGGVSWPMQWYLRDYPNKRFFGASMSGPPGEAPVVLVASDRADAIEPYLTGYTATEYVLRWWFPEEVYRNFAIAPELPAGRSAWESEDAPHGIGDVVTSIIDSTRAAGSVDGQIHLYRLLMYRDLEQPLGQYRFKMYVRNDLIPLLNEIRY